MRKVTEQRSALL